MIHSGFSFVDIPRLQCENHKNYTERCYFIINNLRSGNYTLEQCIDDSLIYHSITRLGCRYGEQLETKIQGMSEYACVNFNLK